VTSAPDRLRLLVIRNDPTDPPALLGEWWREVGVEVLELLADEGEPVPRSLPEDIDGLVILGGSMAAWEDHIAPWLADERALVSSSVSTGVPVLGVCLGGQIMTLACGGLVERTDSPEVGMSELTLLPSAVDDPLFRHLPQGVPVGQFHIDAMTALPPSAVPLASTPSCATQAYRLGSHAWALQFHPEVDGPMMATWLAEDTETVERLGLAPEDVVAAFAEREQEMVGVWRPFAHAFAEIVRLRAASI